MNKPYRDEDLIRFIFDEMNSEESEALLNALVKDEALWNRYEKLQSGVEMTQGLKYEPSEESVEAICAYVRATQSAPEQAPDSGATSSFNLDLGRFSVNLNAVMAVSLSVVLTLGVLGSAYKLTRQVGKPNEGPLVQQVESRENSQEEIYDWEMKDIDQELEHVRQAIETIQEDPLM